MMRDEAEYFAEAAEEAGEQAFFGLVAGSLGLATGLSFLMMVLLAWPVAAGEIGRPITQLAALPSPILSPEPLRAPHSPQPRIPELHDAAAPTQPVTREASLPSLARPPQIEVAPCDASISAARAAIERSLITIEQTPDSDGADQCRGIRAHLALLVEAVRTFRTCPTDGVDIRAVREGLGDWRRVAANGCR